MSNPINSKADRVQGATAGDFAALDENGNLIDSGKNAADIGVVTAVTSANGLTLTSGTLAFSGAAYALGLFPTAIKTANYNLAAGDFVPFNTTSGNLTCHLPTAPPDGTRCGVKLVIQGGTNTVVISTGGSDVLNKAGGSTSDTLSLPSQGVLFQYQASTGIWYVVGDDLPLSQLDLRYETPAAVVTALASYLPLAGGTLTGALILPQGETSTTGLFFGNTSAQSLQADNSGNIYLNASGSGNLSLNGQLLKLAGGFETINNNTIEFTTTGFTQLTLPTSGTLATTSQLTSGTVTSIGLTVPSILSVSPAAITSSGTFAVTLPTQAANKVFAGPTTGSAAIPTMRSLVAADIPSTLGSTTFSGGLSIADNQYIFGGASQSVYFDSSGDIVFSAGGSGTIQLPNGTLFNNFALTLAGNLTTSGAFATTLTTTAATNVTLPTSGTLLTTTGSAANITGTSNSTLTTLSGLTTASSLVSVGTITTGGWAGTTIAANHGGTGVANAAGSTITLGGAFTTSGAYATTLTLTATTNVTLPTSGILAVSASGSSVLSSAYTLTTSYANTGLTVSLPSAGTYRLMANMRIGQGVSSDVNTVQLYNSTTSAIVTGSIRLVSYGLNAGCQVTVGLDWILTVTGATTINLQAQSTGTTSVFNQDTAGSTTLDYNRI